METSVKEYRPNFNYLFLKSKILVNYLLYSLNELKLNIYICQVP